MADEDEGVGDKIPHKPSNLTASVLCELPSKEAQNSDEDASQTSILDQNAPWIAVHGAKNAVIINNRTHVELVDVSDVEEMRNGDKKTIKTQEKVLAMAFSACGEFLAIAEASGMLSLYKSNGTLLFGHRVVRSGGSDSIVSIKFTTSEGRTSSSDSQDLVVVTTLGMLLRLGDLRLVEFEQLLLERPKDALSVILRNIRFARTNVGRLKEHAKSCLLVHRFRSEEVMILGNHGAFVSGWKAALGNQEEGTGIEKVSVCDSRSAPVEAMAFDGNWNSLVILSEGNLSWWNYHEMTEMFVADVSGIMSFAIIKAYPSDEELESASLLAVARATEDDSSIPSLELVRIVHSESGKAGDACVVSRMGPTEDMDAHAACTKVALFASSQYTDYPQALAACRARRGVAMILLAGDGDISTSEADESFDGGDGEISFDEAVTIAKSLVDIPIPSLTQKRARVKKFLAKLNACTSRIGESDDGTRTILKHLLTVAASIREYTSSSPRSSSRLQSLLRWCNEISELSYKWTTFQLLRSSSTTEGDASRNIVRKKWHSFQAMSMVETLENYIKLGSMRAIRTLWGRHLDDAAVRHIGKLLEYLPASLPVSAYAIWIQNEVIPTLFRHVEQAQSSGSDAVTEADNRSILTEVTLWLLKRSEAAAAKGDLDSAIRICSLLKTEDGGDSMSSGELSFYEFKLQTSTSHSKSMENGKHDRDEQELGAVERIERLGEKLRHVKHLVKEHHFVISLSVFEGETPATIAMSMLDRVFDPESLKKEIKDHVRKYLRFCDVDVDPVLHDYVTELAESIQCPQSVEETRALVLLDEISNANIRADATLALLRSALPPYSQALKRYASNCTQWRTARLEEIEEHVRLMKIQDMLTTYDIKQFDIADAKSAARLVLYILNQVSRPTTLTDAMLLVDAYSDLHCDRAAVRYTENLLSDSDARTDEVPTRIAMAMGALAEVKKRKDPKSHITLFVSLMEEIIEFGVTMLELEVEEMDDSQHEGEVNGFKPQSFFLCMLKALVTAYLPELKTMVELAGTRSDDSVTAYIESPDYLLSDALLTDLQRICQIEADYGVLLSVSHLRDPKKCEEKLKQLMKPEILFPEDSEEPESTNELPAPVVYVGKGKGKKRAIAPNAETSSVAAKRQRKTQNIVLQSQADGGRGLQQDDERTRLIFDLNRFASAVGIDSKACQSLIAQSAAKKGSILQAVRFSRDLFSRRAYADVNRSRSSVSVAEQRDLQGKFHPAEALKKIAISLSLYTSSQVKEIYDVPFTRKHQFLPGQVAGIQAPMYTLELLRYALCMCEKESFDELLVLFKNTMLVNEILQFTQHNILATKTGGAQWMLYSRWYRGDACALASYEAMKLVTRFAITEHKNLRREVEDRDTIASKRYVSFLVEQRADLLSLQALMSMQELPEDAASVVNTQMGKLLSTVFQSQEIDNYLALGLMLSMKQEDAFHAFRRQISRENVAKDFNRFQQLAFIGADAARAWQQIAFLHQCVELEGNARWRHYLNLLGIECDHKAFQSERRDLQYIRRLVPTLITRSNYDYYTVLEFTRHYQIDDSFPSLVYTEALLLENSATTNLEYQDKIAGVIEEIHEQHLVKLLLKSIPKISGQDYDRLLFIFRLLLENTSYREREEVERRVEVLRNLKVFAAFQAKEGSKDGDSGANTIDQDEKAHDKRVSFHELMAEPRDVLARLVTKENFNILIGLVEPLRLEPDELQMLLLKNMITTNLKQKTAADGARSTSLAQFRAFEVILACLSDTESRVTAAEWLAENFPLGDEKLKALEFALTAAVSGQNGSADPANTSFTGHEALTRLETKILRVKVEVLLQNATSQTSSLAEVINDKEETNRLLALVSEPKKLYLELYRRYALWFYNHSSDMLHAVASSIGDLLLLPQAKLRLDLVREWLVKDAVHVGKSNSSQETREDPFELLESEKLHQADEDFGKRILYLATSTCSVRNGDAFDEQVLSYLVEFAKDSRPRAGVTYRAKMRALRVILRLGQLYHAAVERFVTTKYGIENSDPFFKELLEYTKHFTHSVAFEEHRVPYDMTFVLKSDKEVLTRSFLRRFPPNQPWVLRCAAQLILDFGVEAIDLWEDVLTNMLQLGMVRSLATIMGPLSRKSFVRSLGCGQQVWEDVLTLPMIQLKEKHTKQLMDTAPPPDTNSSTQETKKDGGTLRFAGIPIPNVRSVMERMVNLLERCPFLDQIDVPAFVIHLRDLTAMAEEEPNGSEIVRQLNLYGFAVKCAMVIPKPVARFEALVRIIQAGAYTSVLHELLDTSCFLDGEQSENAMDENGEFAENCRLIQESFSEAAKREDYAAILGTPFEPGFVEYLAATADIDYLLSLLLEDNRMETALNAVELYYEYHPTAAPSQEAKPDDDEMTENACSKRWELIDVYLASSKSTHLERFRASRQ